MLQKAISFIDTFIPDSALMERADLSVARNFVFTHIIGPTFSQVISIYLYRADQNHSWQMWLIIACISLFWTLPFIYKLTKNIHLSALLTVQLLTFTSLFGTFNYGGVSSPFLPWLIVALLLGFFYLSDRTAIVFGIFAANFVIFVAAYFLVGFPEIVRLEELEALGWMSILSATVYMSWMAIYYASVMTMRSELEIEVEHHRKTASTLAETKRRADEASRSKSIFLAKMSHEFRTPLNAIIGYSELVLESIVDEKNGSDQTVSDLKRVNSSGRHLLALINDILDLSKIESDTVELVKSEFDLGRFAADLIQTVEPMAAKNGNAVELQCPNRVGSTYADETKLRQILLNLLSNACKFTRNGVITLTVKHQKTADRDWIEFRVADTGIGISTEDLKKLFTNYQQASTSTSRNYGGTGLGLAISQKLSAFMGGNISVASEPGRGSVFTLRLPVEKTPARQVPVSNSLSTPLTFATA